MNTASDRNIVALTQVSLITTDRTGSVIYKAIEGETAPYNGTNYNYNGISNIDIKINRNKSGIVKTSVYTIKIRNNISFSNEEMLTADDIIFNYYVLCDASYTGPSVVNTTNIAGLKNYRYNNSLAEKTSAENELSNPSDATKAEYKKQIVIPFLTNEFESIKKMYLNGTISDYGIDIKSFPTAKDCFYYIYYGTSKDYKTDKKDESAVLRDVINEYDSDYTKLAAAYGNPKYFNKQAEDIALRQVLSANAGKKVPNISGIKKISNTIVEITVNGYNASDIYTICGIQVAPLSYYGEKSKYNYRENKFGFIRGDLSNIKAKSANPLGAGAYRFLKYENNVVYFEANDDYYKGKPATKYLEFKATDTKDIISSVKNGTIDISDTAGNLETFTKIKQINKNAKLTGDKISVSAVNNPGYGYIGINADTVNVGGQGNSTASKNLRKAFATVFSVYRQSAISSYFGNAACVINYPISITSWAAPQKSDTSYSIAYSKTVNGNNIYNSSMTANQKYDAALEAAKGFFKASGYIYNENTGKFTAAPVGAKLSYEIIIPGKGNGDHPSYAILSNAKRALASIGITLTINDPADSNFLWDKLHTGAQEMWVAAWGSAIDPDMYQIYHSSNVYPNGTGDNYYSIKDTSLDNYIIQARTSNDRTFRKHTYQTCLHIILNWGIEIPVYQVQNLILFSTSRINISTVTPDITAYFNWMNEIEKLKTK